MEICCFDTSHLSSTSFVFSRKKYIQMHPLIVQASCYMGYLILNSWYSWCWAVNWTMSMVCTWAGKRHVVSSSYLKFFLTFFIYSLFKKKTIKWSKTQCCRRSAVIFFQKCQILPYAASPRLNSCDIGWCFSTCLLDDCRDYFNAFCWGHILVIMLCISY